MPKKIQESDSFPYHRAYRAIRLRFKMSREMMARRAKCSASLIYAFESGKHTPSKEMSLRLHKALLEVIDEADRRLQAELDGIRAAKPGLNAAFANLEMTA